MILNIIAQTLWFFLPAMVANMAPVFAALFGWLPALKRPVDNGVTWHNRRLLGDNKTIRGFLVAVIFGAITGLIQYYIQVSWHLPFAVLGAGSSAWYALLFGGWLGLAALTGDAVKSFFKRQLDIAPGQIWMPWDQVDIVIGVVVFSVWFVPISLANFVIAFVVIGFGMYFVSALGVAIGVKKSI